MGLYAGLVTLAGILRFPDRKRAFKLTAIGVAIVFGVALIGMLIGGFLVDFFRVSLFEIANLGPVYTLREIVFQGNAEISDARLRDLMATSLPSLLGRV